MAPQNVATTALNTGVNTATGAATTSGGFTPSAGTGYGSASAGIRGGPMANIPSGASYQQMAAAENLAASGAGQSPLMRQPPTGGGAFPITDQFGNVTYGQNVPTNLRSDALSQPAGDPRSFSEYFKDAFTDPKNIAMGGASLLLSGATNPEEWDETAGTFPNVNKALTPEQRAAYAMKGLTDPANTTFQPPNVGFSGMPTTLFGREGGAIPFQRGGQTETITDILGEGFTDYVETLPSDRPDTMPDRLKIADNEADEKLYTDIIENEESIMDIEALNNLFNDPDMGDILRSETNRTINKSDLPSRRNADWDSLNRELIESSVTGRGSPKENILFQEGGFPLGKLEIDELGTTTPDSIGIGDISVGGEPIDSAKEISQIISKVDPEDFVSSEGELTLEEGFEAVEEDVGPFNVEGLSPEKLSELVTTLDNMQKESRGFSGTSIMGNEGMATDKKSGRLARSTFGGTKAGPFRSNRGGSVPFHEGGLSNLVEDNYFEDTYGPDWRTRDLSPEEEDRFIYDIERKQLEKELERDKFMEERGYMFDPDMPWTPETQGYVPFREMAEGGSIPFQGGGMPSLNNNEAMSHLQQKAAEGAPWAVELLGRLNQTGGQTGGQRGRPVQSQYGMAKGGPVLEGGSFVIPADVVSSFGDGSSDEGHRKLSAAFGSNFALGGGVMSGEIKGPGGGLDDLVQSSIEGVRSARVSNDEFVIPSSVVRQIGGGNTKAGSEKLYNFIKNVRLNKHGSAKQPASINNVGVKSLLS